MSNDGSNDIRNGWPHRRIAPIVAVMFAVVLLLPVAVLAPIAGRGVFGPEGPAAQVYRRIGIYDPLETALDEIGAMLGI